MNRQERSSRRSKLIQRDGKLCHYCGITKGKTVDHKIPVAKGGTNHIDNLVLSCGPCNSKKGAASYEDFCATIKTVIPDDRPLWKRLFCFQDRTANKMLSKEIARLNTQLTQMSIELEAVKLARDSAQNRLGKIKSLVNNR